MSLKVKEHIHVPVLNGLRAMAAIMVCMYHAAFLFSADLPLLVRILDWGQEGVYVFFVISGVVMPLALDRMNYGMKDFKHFILKRLLRLQPPLIVSAAVMTLISYQTLKQLEVSSIVLFAGSASLTAPLLGLPFVNDIYWTLFVEMQYYLYIALLFPFLMRANPMRRWTIILVLLAASFTSLLFEVKWIKLVLPFHLPVFLIGFFLFLRMSGRIGKREFVAGVGLCAFCCALLTGYFHELGYRITFAALATVLFICCIRNSPAWLNRIGEYSYSLYLFHWLFISLMAHYVRPYIPGLWGSIFLYLLIISMAIAGSKIFYWAIEKPSLNWAKKMGLQYRQK